MKKIKCLECQNEIELEDKEYKAGDITECPHCGSELEVAEVKEDGEIVVELIEEEK